MRYSWQGLDGDVNANVQYRCIQISVESHRGVDFFRAMLLGRAFPFSLAVKAWRFPSKE